MSSGLSVIDDLASMRICLLITDQFDAVNGMLSALLSSLLAHTLSSSLTVRRALTLCEPDIGCSPQSRLNLENPRHIACVL